MKKYTIQTPNAKYNGVTEGVGFANGKAIVEDEYIRNVLVNDYGYQDVSEEEKPLSEMGAPELREKAKAAGIEGYSNMKKDELVKALEKE